MSYDKHTHKHFQLPAKQWIGNVRQIIRNSERQAEERKEKRRKIDALTMDTSQMNEREQNT